MLALEPDVIVTLISMRDIDIEDPVTWTVIQGYIGSPEEEYVSNLAWSSQGKASQERWCDAKY